MPATVTTHAHKVTVRRRASRDWTSLWPVAEAAACRRRTNSLSYPSVCVLRWALLIPPLNPGAQRIKRYKETGYERGSGESRMTGRRCKKYLSLKEERFWRNARSFAEFHLVTFHLSSLLTLWHWICAMRILFWLLSCINSVSLCWTVAQPLKTGLRSSAETKKCRLQWIMTKRPF